MQINKISFKGYQEYNNAPNRADRSVLNALDNARPYLKQIGNCMPYPRDLAVIITDDGCDTFLKAFDYNTENHKTKLLTQGNEHTLTEYGLDFVEDVFRGLEKNNPEDFKNITTRFVKNLSRIIWREHPIDFSQGDWACRIHD